MAAFVTANRWSSGVATHKTKEGRILCTGSGCVGCFPETFKAEAQEFGICDMDLNGHPFRTFLNEDNKETLVAWRSREKNRIKRPKRTAKKHKIQKTKEEKQENFVNIFSELSTDDLPKETDVENFVSHSSSSGALSFDTKAELDNTMQSIIRLQSEEDSESELISRSNNNFKEGETENRETQNGTEKEVSFDLKMAIRDLSPAVQKWIVTQPRNSESVNGPEMTDTSPDTTCRCKSPRENKSTQTLRNENQRLLVAADRTALLSTQSTTVEKKVQLPTAGTISGDIYDNLYILHRENVALNVNQYSSLQKENAVRFFFAIEYFNSARRLPKFKVLEIVQALSLVVDLADIKYVQHQNHKWNMVLRSRRYVTVLRKFGIRIRGRFYDLIDDDDRYFEILC